MNKEEIESLFKKYKVRIPKEKQGQSECYECKRHHKYSLTWTSFLYEYEEKYYCFEHILIILLQQENKKYKEVIDKAKSLNHEISHTIYEDFLEENIIGSKFLYERIKKQLSILEDKEVSE